MLRLRPLRHALGLLLLACTGGPAAEAADTLATRAVDANARERAGAPSPTPERPDTERSASTAGPGFRTARLLDEHFAKHGREFGSIAKPEYLRLAQALRDATPGPDVLEIARADGTISRYERSSGSFLAFTRDGTIRTFFRPNDGEAYFRRQARRRPER